MPPSPQTQNNFAQLLANVHDTPDMTVPKTYTMTRKNKQKNYNQQQEKKEEETRKQETRQKQQEEGKMNRKCILNS